MKKIFLFLFLFSSLSLFAQNWGLWNDTRSYVTFNVNGTSATKTVWDAGSSGIEFYNGSDFGTLTTSQTFQLTAYDIKTWKSGTGDVTGGKFYYIVYPSGNRPSSPIFKAIDLGFMSDLLSGNQKWGFTGQSNNILSGLMPGAYSLEIYAEMYGNIAPTTKYDGNNGANYIASFKLAPAAYNVTGSGAYCQGGSGLPVGIDNSEVGITYNLYKSPVFVTPVATITPVSAGAFSFGSSYLAGTYSVTGTNAGGTTAMTGSAVITEIALPLATTVSVTNPTCSSSNGLVAITSPTSGLTFSTNGINYADYTTPYTVAAGAGYSITAKNGNGCVSNATSGTIATLPTPPSAPTGPGSIAICAGAFISVTVGTGETADWYSASTAGTLLIAGATNYTPAGAGTYYAEARNTTTGCVSASRTAVTVTKFNALPTAVISGIATICEGTSTNLTISLTGTNPKNFSYSSDGGSTSTLVNSIYGNSAIISVSPVSTKTYIITSVSDASCGGTFSGSAVITVTPNVTPTFTVKPGTSTCANTYVTYTTEPGQSSYVWTYPGSTSGTDYSIKSGGTSTNNTVTLQWKTQGSKSVGVNYTPLAGCTSNTPTIATTTVEPLIATFTAAPGASTCANTNATYTTQVGQINYIWNIPGTVDIDYTITSGSTSTNSVTLKWLTAGDKTVVVSYTTAGGCPLTGAPATTSVHVNATPGAAGTITGTASVIQGQNGVSYSVSAIANATSYIWAYTTGTGATIHGTGNSITIDFSASATTGNLTAQGLNDCGTGTVSASYHITVTAPSGPIAYAVTGTGSYCLSGGTGISVGLANSETGVSYQLYKNTVIESSPIIGTGGILNFGLQTAGTYTVKGTMGANTTDMTGSAVITAVAPPTAVAVASSFAMMGVPYLLSGATATNYTSVKWTLFAGNGSFSNDAIVQSTFTGTISGQIVTLRLTAKNGVCADATSSLDLVIIPAGVYSKTWKGTNTSWNDVNNWNPGPVPVQTDDVIIPSSANYPIISSMAICNNLSIESGSVTVASGGSLTVAGLLTNSVGAAGLVVKSGGSLIESTTGVTATIERTISTAGKWHYISAPNNNTYSGMFAGNFLLNWNEPTVAWSYLTETNVKLNPVQGYSLWVKAGTPTYSFTGALNSGNQSIGLTYNVGSGTGNDGANFLGNPYPSSLDWAGLQGTYGAVYYWNGTAYESYNNGSGSGSQFVPPMQGFFIVAKPTMITNTGGTFLLSNSNRVHSTTSFYKSAADINSNSLVLATVGESYSDKLFVNFNPSATEGFDMQNDAYKFLGYTAGVSELYSYTGDKKLSIDVRPETQVVQLGFTNTQSGEYQIGIDKIAGIPVVYLEDTKTSTFHDLLTGPYKFSYTAGESDKRFILLFGTTGLKETTKDAANIYSYQKTVYINMADQTKGDIFIYNIAGQQVASRTSAQGMNEIKLPKTGNYIVKVISRNSTVVRKVFIQ